ncbi:MAG: hypothetical protein LBV71_06050 [Prevotella sp.]|nr:hypothetical protein [Prevotella sp.]
MKNEEMAAKYNLWYYILEENWCMDRKLNSCIFAQATPQQQLEFWDSILPSSTEYYYAILKKALVYKKELKDFDTARRILDTIPAEGRKWLEEEYRFDFKKVESFEEKNENK